jgi:hypothetical protein
VSGRATLLNCSHVEYDVSRIAEVSLTDAPVRASLTAGGFIRPPSAESSRDDRRVWLAGDGGRLTERTRFTHLTPPATTRGAGDSRAAARAGGYVTRADLGCITAVNGRPVDRER